jgi:hypothetical protein
MVSVDTQTQVLGFNWNTEDGCLYIDAVEITKRLKGPTTKRKLTQTTASFYDPFELFSPLSLIGKMHF